jgi:V/A-type H+-transporting ATPase subunit E
MASEKLQELIETLKQQGVQKGEETASQIIESSRKQADDIIRKAESEAKAIVSYANMESDQVLKRLKSSMEMAASQFVGNLKRVVEENFLSIPLKAKLTEDLSNPDYLKELMTEFVKSYAADPSHSEIKLLLPANTQEELKNFAIELMGSYYKGDGDKLSLVLESQGIKFGFQVDRKDGNVRFDFTDDAFLSLFKEFLTPKFRELFSSIKVGEAARR